MELLSEQEDIQQGARHIQDLVKRLQVWQILTIDLLIGDDAVRFAAAPGQNHGACRDAHRTGRIHAIEPHTFRREPVKIGRLDDLVAHAAKGVPALLIGDDEEHVDRFCCDCVCCQSQR